MKIKSACGKTLPILLEEREVSMCSSRAFALWPLRMTPEGIG